MHYNVLLESPSLESSSTFHHCHIKLLKRLEKELEEKNDKAEKLVRREQSHNRCSSSRNTEDESLFDLSRLSSISAVDMNIQIAQCLKLNIENKINDKNAFQLQMIDFFLFRLKREDPSMENLQVASAYLDASSKIYGIRVDKVHSDLLKIVGTGKGEKRNGEDVNNDNKDSDKFYVNNKDFEHKRKRRKNQHNILSTARDLKGNLEIYNPLLLISNQRDILTSDMLFQAGLPQHVNQSVALNLYNDVILDKIPISNSRSSKILTHVIEDITGKQLCPSYAAFKFLSWVDVDTEDIVSNGDEVESECHYSLDDPVFDEDVPEKTMNCGDISDQRYDKMAQSIQQNEIIVDFQNIIANNPNPNETYEYSYLPRNHSIRWSGPLHWKVKIKNKLKKNGEVVLTTNKNENEDIELSSMYPKGCSSLSFVERIEGYIDEIRENFNSDNDLNISSLQLHISNEGENVEYNEEEIIIEDNKSNSSHKVEVSENQEAFIGNNLVSLPKLIEKVFVPYSQRAKKINMQRFKKIMWKSLQDPSNQNNFETKEFSSVYLQIPKTLSKVNAGSLSPALAFLSLLHLAHENMILLENQSGFSDLTITSYNRKK